MGDKMILCAVLCTLLPSGSGYNYYQTEPAEWYRRIQEIENTVNNLQSRQNIMEGRQQAITSSMSGEITKLEDDTKTIKRVTDVLVEDNVKINGRIVELKGLENYVRDLPNRMVEMRHEMTGQIEAVQGKVEEVKSSLNSDVDGMKKVTVYMSSQMNQIAASLQQMKERLDLLQKKINALENLNFDGRIAELESRINDLQRPGLA